MHRIIFVIAVFLFSLSSVMGQMIPINLPADGNWPTVVGDSIMIIGPRQNELTEEQRYFNPVYLMVYPGKEHLAAQIIRAGLCDCDLTKPNRRIGVFSVAPNKQVSFSQGNLQYLPAINLWKFANTQYEYLGNANKYLKPTFRNWVDLFGWSANNTTAPFGVSTSTNVADYAGDFVDWGTNTICGDAPGTWRTLSIEEWKYLYHERKNADKLFALGTINGIAGMILLPDDWQLPEGATCQLPTEKGLLWDDNYNGGGYINTNTQANHYQDNIYTLEQWQVMEEAGAVFLPAAGYRENTNFSTQSVNPPSDYVGSYATSTIADKNNYYFMRFIHREVRKYAHSLYRGRAVRLVHDTIVPKPPKRIGVFSVAADKQVSFSQGNLQYTQSTDEWRFAREQYECIGAANIKDGALADKIDLFGWSANNTTAPFGISTSTNAIDYAGDFVDWGVNTISGNAPGTWRTLSMEEWAYLFKKRTNAAQLYSKGSIEGTRGVIVLPDNWALPEGVQFTVDTANLTMDLDLNIYSYAEWQQMEEAGAVFLCVTGRRDGKEVGYLQEYGGYWSSTTTSITTYHWFFNYIREVLTLYDNSNRVQGRSVRLVRDTIVPKPPKRIGVFSVAADKQVSFSQGNLQYIQSTKTWQFAKEQYAYMGEKHYRNGQLADTIEYFGWSGKDSKAPWGISLSTESSDYEGEFLDWGTNTIAGSAPNTWRTLSNDEWLYICQGRKNADQLLGLGKISSIFGLIILPDDWVAPEGITFTSNDNNPNANVYSLQQWTAMEEAGAIFIPPTGYFNHDIDNMRYVGTYGYARNNTLTANGLQIYTLFKSSEIQYSRSAQGNNGNLYYAFPQRLVHDTIVPETIPDPCLVVKVNDTLSINMMCVEGGTFIMGAGANEHQVTLSDYTIGQTEVTQELWEAVMGTNPNANTANKQLPVTNISWYDCQAFINKLNQQTGLRFRLPTEAEWEYAARGGEKSKGYEYAGSDMIGDVAWYKGNSNNAIHTVAKKLPNELGIYDMSGNVWEWCEDYYDTDETMHVVKSGSFYDLASTCRIDFRTARLADYKSYIGLRLVLDERSITPEPEYVDLGLSVK